MMISFIVAVALLQDPAPQPTQVARVVVTPARPTVVAGDSLRLRAQAFDASGRELAGVRLRFVPAGAAMEGSVDSTGLVTAGAPGTFPISVVAITPGARPFVHRFEVAMVAGPAARVEVEPAIGTLVPGQTVRFRAEAFSAAGDLRRADRVTWASSAPRVARVSPDGILTAVAAGSATVTATSGSATRTIPVRVAGTRIASVTVTPSAREARTGDVVRMTASVRDAAGRAITGLTPTWLVAPGKGEIGSDGAFVGYEPGTYEITAQFGPHAGTAAVTLAPRDVRRPAQVVGKLLRSHFMTSEVWVHPNGRVAYLGTAIDGDRVYALDVSNPASPAIVDSILIGARHINDVMTTPDGNYLIITREGSETRRNGFVIADTRDPLRPKFLSEFTEGVTGGVHSAFVYHQPKYGTHVYLTNNSTGMVHVVDISNPAQPREVSKWAPKVTEAGRFLHDIDVQDGLLYGSWWNDGLVILDVGNGVKGGMPSNPQLVTQFKYDLDALYRDVEREHGSGYIRGTHTAWRHRNYVFIADEVFGLADIQKLYMGGPSRAYGRLQVIDISDVEKPRSVAWYEPEQGGVHNIWIAGDTLYLGAYGAGFHAFDISGELRGDLRAQGREIGQFIPSDPHGKVPNATMTWGVVVNPRDGLAYVNDMFSGLYLVRLVPKPAVVP